MLPPLNWAHRAQALLNQKTKPLGSLGVLESIAVRLAEIQESTQLDVGHKRILVFAGSHGIADEQVSAYPTAVTAQMVLNFLSGGAAINVFCRQFEIELTVVDVGVDTDWGDGVVSHPLFAWRPVRRGTRNFAVESAMTSEEFEKAMAAGREQVVLASEAQVKLLGLGEMGIGNSTSASALLCALLRLNPVSVVGSGTGVEGPQLQKKIEVVNRALAFYEKRGSGARFWLESVGGFEMVAMVGAVLEAAGRKLPVVIDGFIATAAAAAAFEIDPAVRKHCIFSHRSRERGHRLVLEMLGVHPLLDFEMALGEGTGSALAMPMIESAARILNEMATFTSANVSQIQPNGE